MNTWQSACVGVLVLGAVSGHAQSLPAPASLPLNEVVAIGDVSEAEVAFLFRAPEVGVLTVVVAGSVDLRLEIEDSDGQLVADGTSDRDLAGSLGHENMSVVLPEAGIYRVRVSTVGSGGHLGALTVGGSWLAVPRFAKSPDTDGRPSLARDLEIGKSHEDAISGKDGDLSDWYRVVVLKSGTLVATIRPILANGQTSEPDLVLELYTGDEFREADVRSDKDESDSAASESVTQDVREGQRIHIRVVGYNPSQAGRYRLSVAILE